MKSFLLVALITLIQGARAETIGGSVHSIVHGKNGEPHLIKFESGLVKFLDQDKVDELQKFEAQLETKSEQLTSFNKFLLLEDPAFEPTVVSTEQLRTIFKHLNPYMRRKSECSDRAHVWASDEFQRSGTKSEKVFLLLTDTYIRTHRYKWWFHVAPVFTTTAGQKMVTDFQFLDRPVTFNEWKNNLVFTKRECVREFKFLDYNAGADQSQDCYVKFEPMYYRIPGDIGNREQGTPRTNWNTSEVNASRSRAFFKGSR